MKIRNIYDNQIDEAFFSKQRDAYKTVRNLNSLSKKVETLKNSDFQVTPEFLAALYYKQGPESPRTAQEVNSTLKSVLNNPKAVRNSQIAALKLAQTIFQSNDHDPQEFVTRATTEAPQAEPLPEPETQAEDPLQPQQAQPQQAQPQQAQPQQAQPQQAQPQQAQPQQAQQPQAQPQQAQQPQAQPQQAQQPKARAAVKKTQSQQAVGPRNLEYFKTNVAAKAKALIADPAQASKLVVGNPKNEDQILSIVNIVLGRYLEYLEKKSDPKQGGTIRADNRLITIDEPDLYRTTPGIVVDGPKRGQVPLSNNVLKVKDKILELCDKIYPTKAEELRKKLSLKAADMKDRGWGNDQNLHLYYYADRLLADYSNEIARSQQQQQAPPQESYYYSNAPIQERMSDYVRSISDPEYQKFLSTSQDEDKQVEFANISTLRNIIHNMILQYTKEADQALQSQGSNIKTYTQQLAKYLQGQKYASRSSEAAAAADKYKRPNQIQAPPEKEPENEPEVKQEPQNNDAEPDWYNPNEDEPFNNTKERFYESKKRAIKDSTIPSGTYIFEADWYEF